MAKHKAILIIRYLMVGRSRLMIYDHYPNFQETYFGQILLDKAVADLIHVGDRL